jgi:hypothetical protein
MKVGTLTTGDTVVSTFDLQYVPQYLYYIAATQLTGIKVTIQDDGVLLDLDATGLSALSGIRRYGRVTNDYLIPLADGQINNKLVEIVCTNSAAQTPDLYAFSMQKGLVYIATRRQKVLASSGVTLRQFGHLGFSTVADTDEVTIRFVDGHVQKMLGAELKAWYTLMSNETDSYVIDNLNGLIDYINVIPAADRTLYVTKYLQIGNIS